VLEPASVIGLQFDTVALRAIAGQGVRPRVPALLGTLVGKQLVAPLGSPVASIDTYRFEHAMIRDSAYGRLLKRRRAELHEQLVDWAEEARADRIGGKDLDEVLGFHLEQAHRYLRELGPLDEHGRALGRRASLLLAEAGRRAFSREDMPSAADLLERAVDTLEPEDAGRPLLLLPLAEALMHSGAFERAQARLGELTDPAAATPAVVRAPAQVMRMLIRAQVGEPGDWVDAIVAEARRAVPVLDAAGDEGGLAAVTRWVAWAHGTANRYAQMAVAAEEALGHAVLAGDERQRRRASVLYAMAATYGPTPVPEAISRCREILARTNVDRGTQGLVMGLLARLVAMDGDFEQARGLYRSAQGLLRELGGGVSAAASSLDSFEVERLAGDVDAAAAELRRDRELLEAMGETYLRSTITAYLAKLLAEAGRLEEAAPLAEEARSIADEEDVATQAVWRLATARVMATQDPERAEALVTEAVELVRATDARLLEAEALQDLALVQRAVGRESAARTLLEQAAAIRRAKGDVVGSAGVEALLAELAGAENWRVLGRAGFTTG
jgi:tetratricopeptide (TPR) repeat protein